jgi:2-methylcitrate dehydratase PrpD
MQEQLHCGPYVVAAAHIKGRASALSSNLLRPVILRLRTKRMKVRLETGVRKNDNVESETHAQAMENCIDLSQNRLNFQ